MSQLALRTSEPPESDVTLAHVVAAGRRRFQAGERLDLREIAKTVGIGRTTLHRWVGTRERYLGLVIASLSENALKAAEGQVPEGTRGADRVAAILEIFLRGVAGSVPLRTFIQREPAVAARVLLSQEGDVTQRIELAYQQFLIRSIDAASRPLDPDPATMARILVRTGDTFFYADLLGQGESDIETAILCVRMVLRAYAAGMPARLTRTR
jgi:AcrR family transcriptional regulator